MNRFEMKKLLVAIGLKQFAATAEPKDLAVAMDAMDAHAEGCDCSTCKPASKDAAPEVAVDAKAADRKRAHDALDKMLNGKEEEAKAAAAASDKDMEDLKSLFASKDAEPTDKREDANAGETAGDSDNEEEEEEEETPATDEAVQSEAAPIIEPSNRPENLVPSAVDQAFREGQRMVLKALKPFVAKSNDPRLKGAFDTANKLTKSAVKIKTNAYASAASAAAAVAKDSVGKDPYAQANAAYKEQGEKMRQAGKR